MSDWIKHVKQAWVDRRLDEFKASRENRKPQRIQSLPGYQYLNLRDEEGRSGIPQSILNAYDFYFSNVESNDYGSVCAFKEHIQNRDLFVVNVNTDGSNGWLEIFDQDGQSVCAARTSQERIAWGEVDVIRAYAQDGGLPVELRTRRTDNECFNDEQEAKVSECFEKWKRLCFSNEGIDQSRAVESIKVAYQIAGFDADPEITFCDSPYAIYYPIINDIATGLKDVHGNDFGQHFQMRIKERFNSQFSSQILESLVKDLEMQVYSQVDEQLRRDLVMALQDPLWSEQAGLSMGILESHIATEIWKEVQITGASWASIFRPMREIRRATIQREALCIRAAVLDVYISVLGCTCDSNRWSLLQDLASSCGWFIPFREVCKVSNYPVIISFDAEGKLHAQDEAAILFIDGFSVYASHGKVDRIVSSTA